MKKKKSLLLFFLFSMFYTAFSQSYFTGKVADTEGVALAFVAVIPNDDITKGVLTDIEGRFSITTKTSIQSLTFRCVGLQTLRVDADFLNKNKAKTLEITLKNAENAISEVVISAGENPADRIIRKAVANRDKNNPEKLETFKCQTYNKVIFDMLPNDSLFKKIMSKKDTADKKVKKGIQNFTKTQELEKMHHIFLMETVTERNFRFPNDNFERVLLNRVSGFPNAGMVALANMIQPFSFYGDFIRVLDKNYVNPISKGSPNLYFFNIEDTLYQGIDTVFILSFHPRKGRIFEGLEGLLHINNNQWAVQNVHVKPSNKSVTTIKLEQQYHFNDTAKQWFPEQLNFELVFPKYPDPVMGMRAVGRSYISDVVINPPLRQRDFNPETPLLIEDKAFGQPDSAWSKYRTVAPLSKKESVTYNWLDSIGRGKDLMLIGRMIEVVTSGKLPLKNGISLDLDRVIKFSAYEKVRLGVGFTNAQTQSLRRPKFLETSVYTGFGFKDKALKYGGALKLRLSQSTQSSLQLSYANDLIEPGAPSGFDQAGLASRSLYANLFDKNKEIALALGSRLGKRIFVQTSLKEQRLTPTYAYRFKKNSSKEAVDNFNFTEASFYLKYEYNQQNSSFFGENANEINKIPVVEVNFTRGFDNLLRGGYKYEKWAFAVHQSIMIRRLGRTTWRIEGGKESENVPFTKLFTLNQGSGGFSAFAINNTFQTLGDTVWLSNKFISAYFKQEIGNILYRKKWSQPQLSLVQNASFGQLPNPEAHQNIAFLTAEKPLLESGLILDNLLRVNYVNFSNLGIGIGGYYRWGYHTSSDWRKNLALRASFRMSL